MRTTVLILAFVACTFHWPTEASAQQPEVVGQAEIEAALEDHRESEEARRAVVRRVLESPEVRRVARAMGVDTERLERAAEAAGGERLAGAAREARTIESRLAGGQSITISATTLIIILLLVILVIVAD